jgi:ABC-2 type transport system ATP-binding protein
MHNRGMNSLTGNASAATRRTDRPALAVARLRKQYAGVTAVDDVSFTVARGEIVGLLGPNGAGKTTTINMILGVLEPTAGSVTIDDVDIAKDRARALKRTNFAAVYAALPGNLTVRQNLLFFGLLYGIESLRKRIEELLEEFDLTYLRDTKCGLLSSGEQTRAALAKALINRPTLLLLDEPTASLDPSAAQSIRERIQRLASRDGCGILWTSHNMLEVQSVCDRVLFLSRGKVLLEGDPRTLPQAHGEAGLEELFIRIAREPLLHADPSADAGSPAHADPSSRAAR